MSYTWTGLARKSKKIDLEQIKTYLADCSYSTRSLEIVDASSLLWQLITRLIKHGMCGDKDDKNLVAQFRFCILL